MKFTISEMHTNVQQDLNLCDLDLMKREVELELRHLELHDDLNDLTALQNNIKKHRLTEQITDLIGGTLQEYGINLDSTESCLEGLADALKNAGKIMIEAIKKILIKIREFLKAAMNKLFNYREDTTFAKAKQYAEKNGIEGIPAFDIPPKEILLSIINDLGSLSIIKEVPGAWLGNGCKLFRMKNFDGDGNIRVKIKATFGSSEKEDLISKGYRNYGELMQIYQSLSNCAKDAQEAVSNMESLIAGEFATKYPKEVPAVKMISVAVSHISTELVGISKSIYAYNLRLSNKK